MSERVGLSRRGSHLRAVGAGRILSPAADLAALRGRCVRADAPFAFQTTSTAGATINTVDHAVELRDQEILELGTCNLEGAEAESDTVLRLVSPAGVEVASNDDGEDCFGPSFIFYQVPVGGAGAYEMRVGCFGDDTCSGWVAYRVTPAPAARP